MRFSIVTLFPEAVDAVLRAGVLGRARTAGLVAIDTVDPRTFTHDKHRTVDDTPYGGGPGMVMKPEPLLAAIAAASTGQGGAPAHRVLLAPTGAPLTQAKVRELATRPHLVLVCGRYEGIDERVAELAIDETISLGDFVLTGGELAAAAVVDAVARYVPGVLGEASSTDDESFSAGLLEYPQYTRPLEIEGRVVPEVLRSGDHAAVRRWRRRESLLRTAARRPELFARHAPTGEDETLVADAGLYDGPARTYLVLCHHPVRAADGSTVTTGVTNLDLHDLGRTAMTYGLGGFYATSPIELQRERIAGIATTWREEAKVRSGDHRSRAVAAVETRSSVDEVVAEIAQRHGAAPVRVVTSARGDVPVPLLGTEAMVAAQRAEPARPWVVVLGTGWGLADEELAKAAYCLEPVRGPTDFNHLSVRSAAACLLDRLFGRRA